MPLDHYIGTKRKSNQESIRERVGRVSCMRQGDVSSLRWRRWVWLRGVNRGVVGRSWQLVDYHAEVASDREEGNVSTNDRLVRQYVG